ncbi:MAG: tyrosine-type recombinase/integrase [Verrucomicrobiales bacterium]|nr:tyrosine-type recombinase/integrase [Verrucomicrobiales bacterium]
MASPANPKFPMVVKVGAVSVKIYRSIDRGRYTKFTVPDYSTGKRRLRQFADLAEAKSEAERLANLLSRGESAAASLGANERASYGRAIELLSPTGDSLELACARYGAAVQILGQGDLLEVAAKDYARRHPATREHRPTKSVRDALIASRKGLGASPRYLDDLESRLDRFCETFGAVPIATIGTSDVQRWLDGLGLSPQSIVNYRRVLVTLFEYAEARGSIGRGDNPALQCETPKVRRGEVEIFTPDELRRLLEASAPAFRPCLAIGALAGLRSAEIERLDWDSIDLERRYIKVAAGKAKTRSRRLVPVCASLADWLGQHKDRKGPLWDGGHDTFYAAQKSTVKAAREAGHGEIRWKANGLRHSYASYRLAATSDAAKVAHEMGNSPAIVHAHYAELVTPAEAEEWFNVRAKSPGPSDVGAGGVDAVDEKARVAIPAAS